MSKIIEAKAVISAVDKTGAVLDQIAKKFKGVEKAGKALENVKAPKFTGDLYKELERLKLSEKELAGVRKEFDRFHDTLKAGPIRASNYFRAIDEWKGKTVDHWRNVKAAVDETDKAHQKFFKRAGRFALLASGVGGAAYAVGNVGRAGFSAAAIAQRESARDFLAGVSSSESDRLAAAAQSASTRYRSVDAATMHERLRDTAMSTRSTDKAIELADTIAEGTTVLQSLKGKDKAIEEGRKFFAALDVLGKNIDPKEVRELFDGYIKALGVEGEDMDLGGALSMARQSRAAGGVLSNRFLMTTAPGLARDLGDPQLGTALSSSLSQNVGGRATKASKAAQQAFGLRDGQGRFLDSDMIMRDPDKYAWERIIPALQKKGVDVNDNVKVTEALAKLFSNRVVQDVFGKLITQREQYQAKAEQYGRAPGLSAAGPLMGKDPFVAFEALQAQLRNFAALAPVMDTATKTLNDLTDAVAKRAAAVQNRDWLGLLPEDDQRIIRGAITAWNMPRSEVRERQHRDLLQRQLNEQDQRVSPGFGLTGANLAAARLKQFELQQGINAIDSQRDMPPIYSDAELKQWEAKYGNIGANVPLPRARPAGLGEAPPVQPLEGAEQRVSVEGKVEGQADINVKVEAGDYLKALVSKMEQGIKLLGSISSNGAGSTGKSSPDANAPATGFNTGMPLP
ncbi:hypothetical protein [Bradyrhizobium vignae]|uniref:hypothetical protein n=1 Tax=Bradyrhizobium vignae TaxID=1549949 RepID=UPI00100AB702|nr:hypothetical protein [Bradyrhizobium vignae]RXG92285.1 hypothetical protein EAV90_27255 [Bradyrhizobium vignae]